MHFFGSPAQAIKFGEQVPGGFCDTAAEKLTGKSKVFRFCGKPEGLSFSKYKLPLVLVETLKFISAIKFTKSAVCQSPWACAWPMPKVFPFSSSTVIGKLASKNQLPFALPSICTGDAMAC